MELLYDEDLLVFWELCGSDANNAYLLVCPQSRESIIIDAPLNPENIIKEAENTSVAAILITHGHKDHLEGLEQIVAATGAPVAANLGDSSLIPAATLFLDDGELVKAGTIVLSAIHTPGHTPGSLCYLTGKHLFTGDTLYAHSPGETQGPKNTQQLIDGVTKKLLTLPPDTFILPGHGRGTTVEAARVLYASWAAEFPDVLPPLLQL